MVVRASLGPQAAGCRGRGLAGTDMHQGVCAVTAEHRIGGFPPHRRQGRHLWHVVRPFARRPPHELSTRGPRLLRGVMPEQSQEDVAQRLRLGGLEPKREATANPHARPGPRVHRRRGHLGDAPDEHASALHPWGIGLAGGPGRADQRVHARPRTSERAQRGMPFVGVIPQHHEHRGACGGRVEARRTREPRPVRPRSRVRIPADPGGGQTCVRTRLDAVAHQPLDRPPHHRAPPVSH